MLLYCTVHHELEAERPSARTVVKILVVDLSVDIETHLYVFLYHKGNVQRSYSSNLQQHKSVFEKKKNSRDGYY